MFMHPPPPPPPYKPIPVTIWVHGTRPSSFLPPLRREVRQSLDEATYIPAGLHSAQNLDTSLKHYKLTKTLSQADAKQFPFEHLYVFGWTGDLDHTARQGAAFDLYNQLVTLAQNYITHYGMTPHITIISHSHGGNVVLEMTPFYKDGDGLIINRFIALACPVQKAPAAYASHHMFKKIYAFHSHIDMIQVMDPQRLHPLKKAFQLLVQNKTMSGFKNVYKQMIAHPLLSERHFPQHAHIVHVDLSWSPNTEPWTKEDMQIFNDAGRIIKKLTTHLRKYHKGVLHTEFIIPTFINALPRLLAMAEERMVSHTPTATNPDIIIQI